jgi:hypothetical protein
MRVRSRGGGGGDNDDGIGGDRSSLLEQSSAQNGNHSQTRSRNTPYTQIRKTLINQP